VASCLDSDIWPIREAAERGKAERLSVKLYGINCEKLSFCLENTEEAKKLTPLSWKCLNLKSGNQCPSQREERNGRK